MALQLVSINNKGLIKTFPGTAEGFSLGPAEHAGHRDYMQNKEPRRRKFFRCLAAWEDRRLGCSTWLRFDGLFRLLRRKDADF
jgi:hypothetical protein